MNFNRYPALRRDGARPAEWPQPRAGLHARLKRMARWANSEVERSTTARGIALFLLVCLAIAAAALYGATSVDHYPVPVLFSLLLLAGFHVQLVKMNRHAPSFFARHYQYAWRWLSRPGHAVVALDDLHLARVLRPVAEWWATKGLQLDLPRPLEERLKLVAAFREAIFEVAGGGDPSTLSLYQGLMEHRNNDVWAFAPCWLAGALALLFSPPLLILVALALVPYYVYRFHTQRLERNALLLALCDFVADRPRREWLEA